jgi:HAD superfamily hydrolase (TIGR01490 family)
MTKDKKIAALFDLDRTLVQVHTANLYVKYQRDHGLATWWDSVKVANWLIQYTLGIIDAEQAASEALASVKGISETALSARCDDFAASYVEPFVSDLARKKVEEHQQLGHVTAIVTSSSPYVAYPIARWLKIDHVVASDLEVENHCLTGKIVPPLCYREGKVERVEKLAQQYNWDLDQSWFYSDSHTDLPLLLRVRYPIIVNPDTRLAWTAKKRGFCIEQW